MVGNGGASSQMCSPIKEISTSTPHEEHFTVGIKADSRPTSGIIPLLRSLSFPLILESPSNVLYNIPPDKGKLIAYCIAWKVGSREEKRFSQTLVLLLFLIALIPLCVTGTFI